jgi:hypothetical protein
MDGNCALTFATPETCLGYSHRICDKYLEELKN